MHQSCVLLNHEAMKPMCKAGMAEAKIEANNRAKGIATCFGSSSAHDVDSGYPATYDESTKQHGAGRQMSCINICWSAPHWCFQQQTSIFSVLAAARLSTLTAPHDFPSGVAAIALCLDFNPRRSHRGMKSSYRSSDHIPRQSAPTAASCCPG